MELPKYLRMCEIKFLLQLLLTLSATLVCIYYLDYQEANWVLITACLMIITPLAPTFWQSQLQLLICGLLLIGHVFFASIFAYSIWTSSFYFFSTSLLFLAIQKERLQYPIFILMFIGILASGLNIPFYLKIERSLYMFIGLIIVLAVRMILPDTTKSQFKANYSAALKTLEKLSQTIFFIFLKRDYLEKSFAYEKKLHFYRLSISYYLTQLHALSKAQYQTKVQNLEILYANCCAISALRYRLHDFTTLEICEKELQHVAKIIKQQFQGFAPEDDFQMNELEQQYDRILQLVVKNPIIFLLFIHDIQDLFDHLRNSQRASHD